MAYLLFFESGDVARLEELTTDLPDGILGVIQLDPLTVLNIDDSTWEEIPPLETDGDPGEEVSFTLGASRVVNPEMLWKLAVTRFK